MVAVACSSAETGGRGQKIASAQAAASSALSETGQELLTQNGETLVFESITHGPKDAPGSVVAESGALSNHEFQRYARAFAFASEPQRYHFAAWDMPLDSGERERGTRVTTTNPGPAIVLPTLEASSIDSKLGAELSVGAQTLEVLIRVRDFPDWDIPLVPSPEIVSLAELADGIDAKQQALSDREALFDTMAAPVESAIESNGGAVVARMWSVGWLSATIPSGSLQTLLAEPAVLAIRSAKVDTDQAASKSVIRPDEMVGVQSYWDNGNYGDEPNPIHSYGGIAIGIIEAGPVKDEHVAFCENASCATTKFEAKYQCDSATPIYCSQVGDYGAGVENADTEATDHATTVAGAAVSEFLDGQDPGLSSSNRLGATSAAREAKLVTFGAISGFSIYGPLTNADPAMAETFQWAASLELDIVTGGTGFAENAISAPGGAYDCTFPPAGDGLANAPHSAAAENAFDSGAFIATAPGNYCGAGTSGTDFASLSPADIPKVFAVTGLDISACATDYTQCPLDANNSVRGPGPATIGTTTYAAALSFVDMAVPQGVSLYPRCTQTYGDPACQPTGWLDNSIVGDQGTSFAAPRLAG